MHNEGDVKKVVKQVLNDTPDCWWFMPPANGYGRSGIPDFVGCQKGHMFAIETKFGTNTTTANQKRELQQLTAAGAEVWIVRETTVDVWALEFKAWVALCS
jgi:Holliday junction resolvase